MRAKHEHTPAVMGRMLGDPVSRCDKPLIQGVIHFPGLLLSIGQVERRREVLEADQGRLHGGYCPEIRPGLRCLTWKRLETHLPGVYRPC